jgi:hypothetical protein
MELYVSPDGNYGDKEGMVFVNTESFDEHFWIYLEYISDWMRPSYAEWFADNDHDLDQDPTTVIPTCLECDDWIKWVKA